MNLLIRHAEYLLGRRNCVVLPGLGALICATEGARFDKRHPGMLIPPRRRVAFNGSITADDGLLAASYSRGLGVSLPEAERMVERAVKALRDAVALDGSASFGRLGFFRATSEGAMSFAEAKLSPVNAAYAGLSPVDVDRLKGIAPRRAAAATGAAVALPVAVGAESSADVSPVKVSRWRKARNAAAGVAASLAVLVTITLFMLNPIRMANEPQKASLAPIPAASSAMSPAAPGNRQVARRLTIGRPSEPGFVNVDPSEVAARVQRRASISNMGVPVEPAASAGRLSRKDRFCVIVASFPTMGQARDFISAKGGDLAILEKDGKCRVYAATAPTYEAANALRNTCGVADAWVCRR